MTDQHGHRISSSEVRTALAVGDLERARHLLGHPFHISGHVIHGQKLGRTLGFPTMNLRVAPRAARSGITWSRSTAWATRPAGRGQPGRAPDGRGPRPVLLEAHLLDETVNAYGKLVRVEFLHKLRDEEKFPDLLP